MSLLILLGLVAAGVAGGWAWREHRARSYVLPSTSDESASDTTLSTTASLATPRPASGVVDRLPRGSGRTQGSRRRSRTRTGFASALNAEGSIRWMRGAQSLAFDIDEARMVTVTASVERGRFRLYLADCDQYRWAEATPGAPLEISGRLITGTDTYVAFMETIGGKVHGIEWRMTG